MEMKKMENLPNLDHEFKQIVKKNKQKRTIANIIISALTLFVILIGGYRISQFFATKNYRYLDQQFIIISDIQAPNIISDSRYIQQSDFFGGEVVSDRYKNINGYHIPWSQKTGVYSIFSHDSTNLISSAASISTNKDDLYAYADRENRGLIPHFYNLNEPTPVIPLRNDLKNLDNFEHTLAEVAITFKKPMTYQEIQEKIPQNILINWYWIGTHSDFDTTSFPSYLGLNANHKTGKIDNDTYEYFVKQLKQAPDFLNHSVEHQNKQSYKIYQEGFDYAKTHNTLKKATFNGLIISGRTQNLAKLSHEEWIYGAVLGETILEKPNLLPTKE